MRNMAIRVVERPPRTARHRGKACQDFFLPSNHPRHHPGTVLQGGNGGKPILSFVSNTIIWQTNSIIGCVIPSFYLSNSNLSSVILFFSSLPHCRTLKLPTYPNCTNGPAVFRAWPNGVLTIEPLHSLAKAPRRTLPRVA